MNKRKRVKLRRRLQAACRWRHDCWYWLRCQFWHRYNVVVCKALPPTWCDRDYLMLFATFQILEDFVEREEGHFFEDVYTLYVTDCGEERARQEEADWDAIRSLYAWWKVRKTDKYADDYDQDNAMLKRLIDLRKYLWT